MKRGPKPKCRQAICTICGREWIKPYLACARSYCSFECRRKSKLVDLKCQQCGEVFRRPYCRSSQKFCSKRCSEVAVCEINRARTFRVYRGKTVLSDEFTCRHCGKTSRQTCGGKTKGLYCSRKCAAQVNKNIRHILHPPNYTKAISVGVVKALAMWTKCEDCSCDLFRLNVSKSLCVDCAKIRQAVKNARRKGHLTCELFINCPVCDTRFSRVGGRMKQCSACTKASEAARKANSNHRRRCRKVGATMERFCSQKVFQRDEYTCYICGEFCDRHLDKNDDLYPTLDHVIPLARGGAHSLKNCRCACRKCNSDKRDMTYEEFIAHLDEMDKHQ